MTLVGHILNLEIHGSLPFYSQVILTSSCFHKDNKKSQNLNNFLFKSLDPRITKYDIKNLILSSQVLSDYFNVKNNDIEITEGDHLYHTQVENTNVEIPKVLYIKYTPTFYQDSEPISIRELRNEPSPLNPAVVQKMCDEYMSKYDLERELAKKLRQKIIIDEEGFQLVTSGPLPVKASNLPPNKKKKTKK